MRSALGTVVKGEWRWLVWLVCLCACMQQHHKAPLLYLLLLLLMTIVVHLRRFKTAATYLRRVVQQ